MRPVARSITGCFANGTSRAIANIPSNRVFAVSVLCTPPENTMNSGSQNSSTNRARSPGSGWRISSRSVSIRGSAGAGSRSGFCPTARDGATQIFGISSESVCGLHARRLHRGDQDLMLLPAQPHLVVAELNAHVRLRLRDDRVEVLERKPSDD